MEQEIMAVVMGLALAGISLFFRAVWPAQVGEYGANKPYLAGFGRVVGTAMAVMGFVLAGIGLFWLLLPGPN